MRQFILAVLAAAAIPACSQGGRDRRVLSIDSTANQTDLTLPDTSARIDTSPSVTIKGEPSVSPVEQQPNQTQPKVAKTRAPATRKSRPRTAAKPPAADTSTQAYAPNRVTDSAAAPDTVAADTAATPAATPPPAGDTTQTLARDTAGPRIDTASARTDTVAARVDTATSRTMATSSPAPQNDTVASRAETVSTPAAADTASTPTVDTTVASPPAEASVQAARTAAEMAARTLAVGTQIHAQLDDSITSRRDTVGQSVSAHVMQNVLGPNGRTLIPAGAQVRFTITRLRPSQSKSSQGRLGLRADSIAVNGHLETVQAETHPVPRELRGRGVTGSDAAKVGGGAAAGAVIGGVVGGNTKGAVIGGVAGAAAGAVVANQTTTRDVVVKAKTPVVFVLTAPLVVAP